MGEIFSLFQFQYFCSFVSVSLSPFYISLSPSLSVFYLSSSLSPNLHITTLTLSLGLLQFVFVFFYGSFSSALHVFINFLTNIASLSRASQLAPCAIPPALTRHFPGEGGVSRRGHRPYDHNRSYFSEYGNLLFFCAL